MFALGIVDGLLEEVTSTALNALNRHRQLVNERMDKADEKQPLSIARALRSVNGHDGHWLSSRGGITRNGFEFLGRARCGREWEVLTYPTRTRATATEFSDAAIVDQNLLPAVFLLLFLFLCFRFFFASLCCCWWKSWKFRVQRHAEIEGHGEQEVM